MAMTKKIKLINKEENAKSLCIHIKKVPFPFFLSMKNY